MDEKNSKWIPELPMENFDSFRALLEMAFHGFGGGGARYAELGRTTMFHCIFSNETIYYSSESIKVYNSTSRKSKTIERKLPSNITRFYILFRMFIQDNNDLFEPSEFFSMLPSRNYQAKYSIPNVIRDLFLLPSPPDLVQIRQFSFKILVS